MVMQSFTVCCVFPVNAFFLDEELCENAGREGFSERAFVISFELAFFNSTRRTENYHDTDIFKYPHFAALRIA